MFADCVKKCEDIPVCKRKWLFHPKKSNSFESLLWFFWWCLSFFLFCLLNECKAFFLGVGSPHQRVAFVCLSFVLFLFFCLCWQKCPKSVFLLSASFLSDLKSTQQRNSVKISFLIMLWQAKHFWFFRLWKSPLLILLIWCFSCQTELRCSRLDTKEQFLLRLDQVSKSHLSNVDLKQFSRQNRTWRFDKIVAEHRSNSFGRSRSERPTRKNQTNLEFQAFTSSIQAEKDERFVPLLSDMAGMSNNRLRVVYADALDIDEQALVKDMFPSWKMTHIIHNFQYLTKKQQNTFNTFCIRSRRSSNSHCWKLSVFGVVAHVVEMDSNDRTKNVKVFPQRNHQIWEFCFPQSSFSSKQTETEKVECPIASMTLMFQKEVAQVPKKKKKNQTKKTHFKKQTYKQQKQKSTLVFFLWKASQKTKNNKNNKNTFWPQQQKNTKWAICLIVSQRICAQMRTKLWSRLSVNTQNVYNTKMQFLVKGKTFIPFAKVDAGVVTFTPREQPRVKRVLMCLFPLFFLPNVVVVVVVVFGSKSFLVICFLCSVCLFSDHCFFCFLFVACLFSFHDLFVFFCLLIFFSLFVCFLLFVCFWGNNVMNSQRGITWVSWDCLPKLVWSKKENFAIQLEVLFFSKFFQLSQLLCLLFWITFSFFFSNFRKYGKSGEEVLRESKWDGNLRAEQLEWEQGKCFASHVPNMMWFREWERWLQLAHKKMKHEWTRQKNKKQQNNKTTESVSFAKCFVVRICVTQISKESRKNKQANKQQKRAKMFLLKLRKKSCGFVKKCKDVFLFFNFVCFGFLNCFGQRRRKKKEERRKKKRVRLQKKKGKSGFFGFVLNFTPIQSHDRKIVRPLPFSPLLLLNSNPFCGFSQSQTKTIQIKLWPKQNQKTELHCEFKPDTSLMLGWTRFSKLWVAQGTSAVTTCQSIQKNPLRLRAKAMSLAASCSRVTSPVVVLTFFRLSNALTTSGAFLVYSALSFCSFVFVYCFVPETKGKTLEEMEEYFGRVMQLKKSTKAWRGTVCCLRRDSTWKMKVVCLTRQEDISAPRSFSSTKQTKVKNPNTQKRTKGKQKKVLFCCIVVDTKEGRKHFANFFLHCFFFALRDEKNTQNTNTNKQQQHPTPTPNTMNENIEVPDPTDVAYFGMGWFWGPEAVLSKVDGVVATRVGYTGRHEFPNLHGNHPLSFRLVIVVARQFCWITLLFGSRFVEAMDTPKRFKSHSTQQRFPLLICLPCFATIISWLHLLQIHSIVLVCFTQTKSNVNSLWHLWKKLRKKQDARWELTSRHSKNGMSKLWADNLLWVLCDSTARFFLFLLDFVRTDAEEYHQQFFAKRNSSRFWSFALFSRVKKMRKWSLFIWGHLSQGFQTPVLVDVVHFVDASFETLFFLKTEINAFALLTNDFWVCFPLWLVSRESKTKKKEKDSLLLFFANWWQMKTAIFGFVKERERGKGNNKHKIEFDKTSNKQTTKICFEQHCLHYLVPSEEGLCVYTDPNHNTLWISRGASNGQRQTCCECVLKSGISFRPHEWYNEWWASPRLERSVCVRIVSCWWNAIAWCCGWDRCVCVFVLCFQGPPFLVVTHTRACTLLVTPGDISERIVQRTLFRPPVRPRARLSLTVTDVNQDMLQFAQSRLAPYTQAGHKQKHRKEKLNDWLENVFLCVCRHSHSAGQRGGVTIWGQFFWWLHNRIWNSKHDKHLQALLEAKRVLRPGGRFMCLEFSNINSTLVPLYDAYSFQVIPVLGQVLANDWDSYQYLVESIRKFPPSHEFQEMIEDAGFSHVTHERLTFGVVAIHSGFRLWLFPKKQKKSCLWCEQFLLVDTSSPFFCSFRLRGCFCVKTKANVFSPNHKMQDKFILFFCVWWLDNIWTSFSVVLLGESFLGEQGSFAQEQKQTDHNFEAQ